MHASYDGISLHVGLGIQGISQRAQACMILDLGKLGYFPGPGGNSVDALLSRAYSLCKLYCHTDLHDSLQPYTGLCFFLLGLLADGFSEF